MNTLETLVAALAAGDRAKISDAFNQAFEACEDSDEEATLKSKLDAYVDTIPEAELDAFKETTLCWAPWLE